MSFAPQEMNIWLVLPHTFLIQLSGQPILERGFKMECPCCKAQMRRGTAPLSIDRKGYRVSWDAIPAWVCDQCGESLFETREVDVIQEALSCLDRETVALVSHLSR
jgi:YgiT-type zinc finger domain-containing protein